MFAYRTEILMGAASKSRDIKLIEFARDYIETVTANISDFLSDKPHKMVFQLEEAERDLPIFWERISAEGDLESALMEWKTQHNSSINRPARNMRALFRRLGGVGFKEQ